MVYVTPIGIVVGVGLLAGIILTVAAKFMAVEEDPTAMEINEILPGANCGGCGYAGCADYANALAEDHDLPTNLCPPGGSATARAISEILGVSFEAAVPNFAIMKCSGSKEKTNYNMIYEGHQTCAANKLFYRGRGTCEMACLGFGDCEKVCDYGAIKMENGIAVINRFRCIGCAACAKVCPNNLIELVPQGTRTYVGCSSVDTAANTRKNCITGCIACNICVKVCKFEAISIVDNHAVIDYEKCKDCGLCAKKCPQKVIHVFPRIPKDKKAAPKKEEAVPAAVAAE